MALIRPPVCDFGWQAPGFTLPATDGNSYALSDLAGPKGTLLIFMCNHCPYVIRVLDQLIEDAKTLQGVGIGVAGISANDAAEYPADSFDNMKRLAEGSGLPFPYLYDESQDVAKAYAAACTPDFFGLNADLQLQYRGNSDGLVDAMSQVAETGTGPQDQTPSMGCSIKWRT